MINDFFIIYSEFTRLGIYVYGQDKAEREIK